MCRRFSIWSGLSERYRFFILSQAPLCVHVWKAVCGKGDVCWEVSKTNGRMELGAADAVDWGEEFPGYAKQFHTSPQQRCDTLTTWRLRLSGQWTTFPMSLRLMSIKPTRERGNTTWPLPMPKHVAHWIACRINPRRRSSAIWNRKGTTFSDGRYGFELHVEISGAESARNPPHHRRPVSFLSLHQRAG